MAVAEVEINPNIFTFSREGQGVTAIVVGAGGIGARLIPTLTKILRTDDEIYVFDGDRVEERNVHRQHFSMDDVGLYKAEVMQSRYHTTRIPVIATCDHLAAMTVLPVPRSDPHFRRAWIYMIFGCVDSRESRRQILRFIANRCNHAIYIDGGNDRRSGQVLMGLNHNVLTHRNEQRSAYLEIPQAMPQIFLGTDTDADGESCGIRVDTQTMNVNNMAATIMVNAANMLLMGLPFSTAGWIFSTFNSIQPIPIERVDVSQVLGGGLILTPSLKFAENV